MKPYLYAALACLLTSIESHAYFVDLGASELNGNEVDDFSLQDDVTFDANFFNNAPIRVSVQRDNDDAEDNINFSAVVNNFTGFGWSSFSLRVFDSAALVEVGDVFALTALDKVPSTFGSGVSTSTFDIEEFVGFELGDVFGDPDTAPWRLDVSTLGFGESFSIELSPGLQTAAVPAPATAWLLAYAVAGLGTMRLRRALAVL